MSSQRELHGPFLVLHISLLLQRSQPPTPTSFKASTLRSSAHWNLTVMTGGWRRYQVALAFLYSEEKLSSRESIEVIVSMPSLVAGEELDNEPDNNDEDGDQSERPSQSSIPLTVVVSKGIKERG